MRRRLDQMLCDRGLVRSRAQAQDFVRRGLVTVDGVVARKAGQPVGEAVAIEVTSDEAGMVSRGGVKLAAALDAFGFDPAGIVALDVGASTGGFTQLLAGRGVRRVHAVDVGHGQLDERLRTDPRIVVHEGTDARRLGREMLGGDEIGAVVADLSFVSVTEALGPALHLAAPGAWAVVLVKPQFEVGREGVGKGGIVRDEVLREGAVAKVAAWLAGRGWEIAGRIVSPIAGGSGNVEYLVGARRPGGERDGQE